MKARMLSMLAMAGMMGKIALYNTYDNFDTRVTITGGCRKMRKKSPLDNRQIKARKRSKLAKQTRKKNRH